MKSHTCYPIRDYLELLERENQLVAQVDATLDQSTPVSLVSYDSRTVIPNTLFLCKGAHFQPAFLEMAKEKGAIAYISMQPYTEVDLPCILVRDIRRTMAPIADMYYHHPSKSLCVIGITGTKGKSSTAYYLKHILDLYEANRTGGRCGLISTIETDDGVERFESLMTTPEPLDLQRHLANAVNSGIRYVVMEVSSQALKYHRTLCTQFAVACFLNIGHDHISPIEHPNFEDYFHAKLKIFSQADSSCVNLDSDHAEEIWSVAMAAGNPVCTFSKENQKADLVASNIHKEQGVIRFEVNGNPYELEMPGLFNVENALAALAICEQLHIPTSYCVEGLKQARVPGRMEVYTSKNGLVTAIVDYAHNKMSFETLFDSVKVEYPDRKIITLFGCPGDKALDRRQDMGHIAGKYSSFVVLTEDHPGEEDVISICEEIAVSVSAQHCPYTINPNRGEAIRQAILSCTEPTVLLVAGKGSETSQKRGTIYMDTPSDVEYVRTFLQEYDILST